MPKVRIEYDQDAECPSDEDGWKLYSFCKRHGSFKHPEELGLHEIPEGESLPRVGRIGLRRKLDVGLAFFLSYYEHGECAWFLYGDQPCGVEFQWDGVRVAGLLVWEQKPGDIGAKTYEDRAKDAAGFLKTYTDWANGHVYWCGVEDDNGELGETTGGLYEDGLKEFLSENADVLAVPNIEVDGDAAWLWEYVKPTNLKGMNDGRRVPSTCQEG